MKISLFFPAVFMLLFMAVSRADQNYVTVYNQNLALVKQVREVSIRKSDLPFRFADVAAQLIPTSVHLRSVGGNKNFQVLEQNFEYDLVSTDKILQKYIDHSVEIIQQNGEVVTGILLSKAGGSLVLKTDGGIKMMPWNNEMTINVKELPEGLITRPTLVWELAGVKDGNEKLEVSYLTSGMSWQAEYVGVINQKGTELNLDAWVSIDNSCGATFENASLKLVAGDIHRAPQQKSPRRMAADEIVAFSAAQRGFEERAFFEYHIYELDRPTTVRDNQIKQISLFPPATVNSRKEFYYNAQTDPAKVQVQLVFKNDEAAGLGKPLPAGTFRIYQKDRESLEFVGEDRIDHTPRNEEVTIIVGKAFDLVAERRVVESTKVSQRSERQTIEIEFRNNKEKENVTIKAEENLNYREWKIEESSFPYKKKDIQSVIFEVPVKADGKSTLRYTVFYSW